MAKILQILMMLLPLIYAGLAIYRALKDKEENQNDN